MAKFIFWINCFNSSFVLLSSIVTTKSIGNERLRFNAAFWRELGKKVRTKWSTKNIRYNWVTKNLRHNWSIKCSTQLIDKMFYTIDRQNVLYNWSTKCSTQLIDKKVLTTIDRQKGFDDNWCIKKDQHKSSTKRIDTIDQQKKCFDIINLQKNLTLLMN